MQIQYASPIVFGAKKRPVKNEPEAPKQPVSTPVPAPVGQPVGGYFNSPQGLYEKKASQEFFALLKANGFEGKIGEGSGVSFPAYLGKNQVTVHMSAKSEKEEKAILAVLEKVASQPHQEIRKGSNSETYFFRGYPVKINRLDLDPGHR